MPFDTNAADIVASVLGAAVVGRASERVSRRKVVE